MFAIYRYTTPMVSFIILVISTLLFIPADLLRLRKPALNKRLLKLFAWVIRDNEVNSPAGTTYLLLGTWVIYILFPRTIVELSLLFLAVGDPIASLFGLRFGRDKIWGRKTLQGSFGAFIACALLGFGYFYVENLMVERLLVISVAVGLIAAISELIPVFNLDDNLTFPILCGTQLYVLFYLFGGLT